MSNSPSEIELAEARGRNAQRLRGPQLNAKERFLLANPGVRGFFPRAKKQRQAPEVNCFICGASPNDTRICRDHCHSTGLVRGNLCHNCNVALGHFKDNIVTLERALDYLKRFKDYLGDE